MNYFNQKIRCLRVNYMWIVEHGYYIHIVCFIMSISRWILRMWTISLLVVLVLWECCPLYSQSRRTLTNVKFFDSVLFTFNQDYLKNKESIQRKVKKKKESWLCRWKIKINDVTVWCVSVRQTHQKYHK